VLVVANLEGEGLEERAQHVVGDVGEVNVEDRQRVEESRVVAVRAGPGLLEGGDLTELGAPLTFERTEALAHAGEHRAIGVVVGFEGLDEASLTAIDVVEDAGASLELRFEGAVGLTIGLPRSASRSSARPAPKMHCAKKLATPVRSASSRTHTVGG